MLRFNNEDIKSSEKMNAVIHFIEEAYIKRCFEVIECDNMETANKIMGFLWNSIERICIHIDKDFRIKKYVGLNSVYICINV